ncbi:MAG: 2-amino-4-hydroxy-6-hydroxymethyldihydropteridine diphosphokinase [Muribaculaceae bacterium]
MNKLVISIGSNSKDRKWQIENSIEWLTSVLSDVKVSSIYNYPATDGKSPDYLNAVMTAKCQKDLDSITEQLKGYETVCGRTPASKLEGIHRIMEW